MKLNNIRFGLIIVCILVSFGLVTAASAHEVYVLSHATILQDVSNPSPNPLSLIKQDFFQFSLWAMIGIILVSTVFFISISRKVENLLDPFLMKIKKWAPLIARLTFGISLLASAYYNALFGPELPLTTIAGHFAPFVRLILFLIGFFLTIGLFVRESALIALCIFIASVIMYKVYMLTYANYFGEIILNLILGGGLWSLDRYRVRNLLTKENRYLKKITKKIEPFAFAILRVLFGIAALYASWYAKLFHSQLALDTISQYHLTNFFHFAPLFIVLGALIVESLIGFFLIIGFEIRFTALFFLFFLTLSLLYFGEVVWPHFILLGVNIALIAHGYDNYSLEGRFLKKRNREPVF